MSIAQLRPDAEIPAVVRTLPQAIQEPNKSIFTPLVPESRILSLLRYTEGYPWTINYYGQIINENNTLQHFDPSAPNLTQPYYKVIDMLLQVSSPLTSNYDTSTGITTISGSAITPYKIQPNAGDLFIAKIDTTEDAIFIVTAVSRKTFRKDTLYEISYNLYSYLSVNTSFVTNLEARVHDTYYFNRHTDFFNRDNLLIPSVKEAINRLELLVTNSQEYYFNKFSQSITGTIALPGTNNLYIDPLLIEFILKTVNYDVNRFKRMNIVDLNQYSIYKQKNVLNAVLERNRGILTTVCRRYAFISTGQLNNKVRLGTPIFINVDKVICPYDIDNSLDIENLDTYPVSYMRYEIPLTPGNYNNYNRNIRTLTGTLPLFPNMFENFYYIVSEEFYKYVEGRVNNISYIEFLLYKFINREAISKEDLVVAYEDYEHWNHIQQLYLLPLMWLLSKN